MVALKLSLLTLAVLAAATPVRRATPALHVSVSAPDSVNDVSGFEAEATITNTGDSEVSINPHGTVLSSVPTNDFVVDGSEASGDANAPGFVGAVGKYVTDPAQLQSLGVLVKLAPGESRTVKTNLGNRYDFAPSGEGVYSVSVAPTFDILTADGTSFESITATTVPAQVSVSGQLSSKKRSLEKRIEYASCTSTQQSQIEIAAGNAQTGSQQALAKLNSAGSDSTYVTWFGAASTSRLATVKSHYSNMNGRFAGITYDCSCSDAGTYAYVYPSDATRIYLCPVFFTTGQCGVDSKQGTLVHESSHFIAVGSTQDYAYGQSAAESLASSNPGQAIENADNHEYYEESVFTSCSA